MKGNLPLRSKSYCVLRPLSKKSLVQKKLSSFQIIAEELEINCCGVMKEEEKKDEEEREIKKEEE